MARKLKNNAKPVQANVTAINEGLMLGLVRQHELTEVAELLNAQLQEEISARKRAEEALINSEKLASVGHMAAVLAHEINNPLAAVTNVLFLAQTTKGLPDAARQYLQMADAELSRIAHITRQTLGFYRESSAPITFHLAILFDSVVNLLQAKQISKRAIIEKQCEKELQMTAFQGELRQVVSNLLMNSLDAIDETGKVTLRATSSRGCNGRRPRIRITISDNGKGISDITLSRIFQPFFTTKGDVGNGLGLWVSKQIVEKHGGSIQVRSHTKGPRQGTTFSIVLPISCF
ncbi:HAMP domain-containing sensor histidine kinase [Tunturiibacter empetritectus]|uniref:histidine kinase n=1 Tax=Tunturiibacter lichenicola TaxID=2051959 RepID=A0A852VLK2_9BACT|nr:HAMP domain-containing sensor histidine kinase [Edaphobacter lichenicola]NYF92169.1 signal transduction histidine kinase [Edaphobacter lichenicola]